MNWHSQEIDELVRQALAEDVGTGDATTTAIVPRGTPAKAKILARQPLVCVGLPLVENVFQTLDREMRVECLHNEGTFVEPSAEPIVEAFGQPEPEPEATVTSVKTAE